MNALLALTVVSLVLASTAPPAQAQPRHGASELSAVSMLPVAVSVVAPVALLSAGTVLTVVAVEATSASTVWVLERASDGARASVTLSGNVVEGASAVVGSAVLVTAFSAGVVLSAADRAICFVPNAVGKALLHNDRLTR